MSEEETILEQPAKKRKLDNGSERNDTSIETDMVTDELPQTSKDPTETEENPNESSSVSQDRYQNLVTEEELERLRQFHVLDEVKSNDEDSNDEHSDESDGKSEDLPEEEIERMLEEDLPDSIKGAPETREKPFITRKKIVLEEKGVNHFEVLPLDWIMVRHISGMPIYMHRTTRVCTLSKPYFLGDNNTRRHDIPISAIPCFAYRRALEEEEKQKEIDKKIEEQIRSGSWANNQNGCPNAQLKVEENANPEGVMPGPENPDEMSKSDEQLKSTSDESKLASDMLLQEASLIKEEILEGSSENKCPVSNATTGEKPSETAVPSASEAIPLNRQPVVLPGGIVMPPPRVETISTSWKTQHLNAEQINDYCKKLFKFKTVNIMHFKSWADRRKYTKARKTLQYPTLPEGTKLITIPAHAAPGHDHGGKASKRDWVMNMNDRSYLSVFHEYVRRALQKQPIYHFRQLENASQPYQAIVYIGGMQYGVGYGSSKRQAKSAAARASIHILIPEMKDELDAADPRHLADKQSSFHDFFDLVGIEDPRITDFCAATCEPAPDAILRTCLLRNFGAGDRHIHTEMKKLEFQKIELTMKVGKHTASVICKNKKTAKQRASQAILQALHPHVRSWGSLLRLYGSKSVKSCKEKKLEEQQITLLQDKARHNEPNYAVLRKLRHEMAKLRERDAAVVPIGTLLLRDALPTHSASNLNNVEL